MNDKKLRALLTAVQCGSFGKATAQLGYTQSAMTHMVNRLEAELGCTLLVRGSHGVRLSEEGEKLLPYMQAVIDAGDALRREAAAQGRLHENTLRIGCFASIARARLPKLLRKFRKIHPEIQVDVLVRGYELASELEEENIQLALVDEACGKGFYWTPLTDAPLVAVVPPDFAWEEETISLERLLQEPVSLLSGAVCGAAAATGRHPGGGDRLRRWGHPLYGGRRPGCISAVRLFSGGLRGPGAGDPADAAGVPAAGRGGEGPSGCQHSSKIFPVVPEAAICRSVT